MQGYWQKTVDHLWHPGGWLRTGDLGTMDMQGYFYVVDRLKDMILVSGFNVYPNEIEAQLMEHPAISEVGVIGAPCDQTGECVVAFYVSDQKLSDKSLRRFCDERMAHYKMPKHFVALNALPKSPVGKVLRKELRKHTDKLKLK